MTPYRKMKLMAGSAERNRLDVQEKLDASLRRGPDLQRHPSANAACDARTQYWFADQTLIGQWPPQTALN